MTGGLATASFYNVAIVVSSIDRAVEWYGRVFGFVEQARGPIAEGTVALMNGCGVTLEILEWGLEEEPIRPEVLFADPPYHLLPVGNKIPVFNVDDPLRCDGRVRGARRHDPLAREGACSWLAVPRRSATWTATSSTSSSATRNEATDRALGIACALGATATVPTADAADLVLEG
jgi:catechol 2,3-dioxygenase-like lactoylglutathione lyase family enzyme